MVIVDFNRRATRIRLVFARHGVHLRGTRCPNQPETSAMGQPILHHLGRIARLRRMLDRERRTPSNAGSIIRLHLLLLRAQRLLAAVVSPSRALRPVPVRVPSAAAISPRRLS